MDLYKCPQDAKARDIFWQLLYYYGAMTTNRIAKAGVLWFFSFVVPNAVAKDEYLGTVWKSFSPKHASSLDNAEKNFEKLIQDNDLKPFLNSLVEDDFQFTKWDFGGFITTPMKVLMVTSPTSPFFPLILRSLE